MGALLAQDYGEARAEFQRIGVKRAFREPGVRADSYAVGDGLTIDTLFLPATDGGQKSLVVLLSGQHGVEGPAGSALQRQLLDDCLPGSPELRRETSYLFIHAANPYGFAHGRRFNRDNVDLNRNAFDFQTQNNERFPGRRIHNEIYERVKQYFAAPMNYVTEAWRAICMIWDVYSHGGKYSDLMEAIGGQYQDPRGIYYGGEHVEPENEVVQRVLLEYLPRFRRVFSVNIHTGLGPNGIASLLTTAPSRNEREWADSFRRELAVLHELFPAGACGGHCRVDKDEVDAADPFAFSGTLTHWIYERFGEQRRQGLLLPVVLEIGTFSTLAMLPKIVNENYCFHNPDECGEGLAERRRERLRAAFNPRQESWVSAVGEISRGLCGAVHRYHGLFRDAAP